MGAWLSYGLGSMNQDLPTFVVLPDMRGFAPNGPGNWSAGFLPATHQGTLIKPSAANPIADLFAPDDTGFVTPESETEGRALLESAESPAPGHARRRHPAGSPHRLLRTGGPAATERTRSARHFARNGRHAHKATGWTKKSPKISAAIACSPAGCWSAAFGSCRSGAAPTTVFLAATGTVTKTLQRPWRHGGQHGSAGRRPDPRSQGPRHVGRHSRHLDDRVRPHALCARQRAAITIRSRSLPGSPAAESRPAPPTAKAIPGRTRPRPIRPIATTCTPRVLHLLGIDHEKLTFRSNGIDRRLTDVHGHVISELLG